MKLINKNECIDIFRNFGANKKTQYLMPQSADGFIKYKFKRNVKLTEMNQIDIILNLKVFSGIDFIFALKRKHQLVIDCMVTEFE